VFDVRGGRPGAGVHEPKVYYSSKQGFQGVSLDVDDTSAYGPETMTWDDSSFDGAYQLVVHVFSTGGQLAGSQAQVLISMRDKHLVTVQPTKAVLDSDCRVTPCFWFVGTVSKQGRYYEFASANARVSQPTNC
jgi:hypothetical protein